MTLKRMRQRFIGFTRRMSMAYRVLVLNLVGIALVTIVLVIVMTLQVQAIVTAQEDQRFHDRYHGFLAAIDERRSAALALAATLAQDEEVQADLSEQVRTKLTSLTMPYWLALDNHFDISEFQFITPPATVFLRLNNLDVYGDDVGAYRHSVVDAISQKVPVSGLEMGRAGLNIHGVAPMWYGPQFVGVVDVGIAFDRAFLQSFAQDTDVKLSVHLFGVDPSIDLFGNVGMWPAGIHGSLLDYATTADGELPVSPDIYQTVLETQTPVITRIRYEKAYYGVLVGPLYDYSQRVIGVVEIAMPRSAAVARIRQGQLEAVAGGLVVMAVAGILSYRWTRRTMAPLAMISEGAMKVAEGDLGETIPVAAQNEIGVLAGAYNLMVVNLQQLLAQIAEAVERLSGSGDRLATELDQMNSASEQVSMTVSEMASGAGTQARRAEDASHAMAQLATATSQITENARRTGDSSTHALQTVDEVREVVETLDRKAKRIEQIVVNVDKIADQTNLLALNASIEAARAGEYGAGFAVVAQEVRRLAETSTQLVGEIADINEDIGDHLSQILERMGETQEAVGQTAIIAQETAIAAREQEVSSDAMVSAINEIAAVAEQSAVSSEEVATTVEQQVASVETIAAGSQVLADLASQLRETLARYRVVSQEGVNQAE